MSVKLRFQRVGMPKQPHFRLVAIDSRAARDSRHIEILGHYDPRNKENAVVFKNDRVTYWLSKGAQPSDTVRSLLIKSGLLSGGSAPKTEKSAVSSEEASSPTSPSSGA